jgi:hypothetical protein
VPDREDVSGVGRCRGTADKGLSEAMRSLRFPGGRLNGEPDASATRRTTSQCS